jgi:hypothetical protein
MIVRPRGYVQATLTEPVGRHVVSEGDVRVWARLKDQPVDAAEQWAMLGRDLRHVFGDLRIH